MTYKQFDYNFERVTFTIEETGINIKRKTLSSSSESFRRFEEIGKRIAKEKSRKIGWLAASIFFAIVAAIVFINRLSGGKIGDNAEIFWLVISLVLLCVYVLTKNNYLYLTHNDFSGAIEFINRKQYKKSLPEFIDLILEKRKEYLLNEYYKIDDFVSAANQEENLVWLYHQELITKEQLTEKLEELKNHHPDSRGKHNDSVIGFKRTQEN